MLLHALVLAASTYGLPPKRLPYHEGDPVPPGYHPGKRARVGLIVLGSIGFGLSWLCTAALTGTDSHDGIKHYGPIPVFGPLISAAVTDHVTDRTRLGLVAASAIQAGFAVMIPLGIIFEKDVLWRDDVALTIAPTVGPVKGAFLGLAF